MCSTGISCNLDKCRRRVFGRFRRSMRRYVSSYDWGRRATAPLRHQHFLKRDTVFLKSLVYSECSAFRFPGARSEQVISPFGEPHGQESEEGEEGSEEGDQERREEDREEDQEGREEEVTSSPQDCRHCRRRHTGLGEVGFVKRISKCRPCRRKRVSARHQVNGWTVLQGRACLSPHRSGRNAVFVLVFCSVRIIGPRSHR